MNPELYRALAIRSGLKLLIKGIKPNTRWTMTSVLATVSQMTGKVYTRKNPEAAIADLTAWIESHKGNAQ